MGVPVLHGVQSISQLTLYGTLNFGRSYTNNTGNFLLSGYDLVGDSRYEGRMSTLPSWSYLVGATYHFNRKLYSTLAFGQARVTESHFSDQYKYGLYGAANLFYNLTPRILFGGEFTFGKRAEFSATTHGADASASWPRCHSDARHDIRFNLI